MSFRFLLPLLTYPDLTPRAGLFGALEMASKMGGNVTALIHEAAIPDVQNVLADALIDVSGMVAAAESSSRANAADLTDEVNRLAQRFGLSLELRRERCRLDVIADLVGGAARTFDYSLLVAAGQSDHQVGITEAVLFGSGGPAMVFPEQEGTSFFDTAAVAWDGTRTSARALRDALPVIRLFKRTVLLTVDDDKVIDLASVADAQALLRLHDVEVNHAKVAIGTSIGETLQQAALDRGAGLLVMGAYGHNRFRELILGGATRSVLGQCRLPLLMSH